MRSYFITPRRLTTNTFLWKTINMMMIINKDRIVEVPQDTRTWLYSNWDKITPENAVLCIEYSEKHLDYAWQNNPTAAQKVLDVMMTKKDMWEVSIRNEHLKESVLLTFIEGPLRDMIIQDGLSELKRKDMYRLAGNAQVYVSNIFRRSKVQTYQIELIYGYYVKSYPNINDIVFMMAEAAPLELIPDYIFEKMVPYFHKPDPAVYRWNSSTVDVNVLQEAIRRGMLRASSPSSTVIFSQPKPTLAGV